MRINLKVTLLASVSAAALLIAQPEQAHAQNLIVAPTEEGTYGAVQGRLVTWGSTQERWTESGDGGRVDERPYGATGAIKLGRVASPDNPKLQGWDFAAQFATGLLDADGPASGKTDEPDHAFGDCSTNSTSGGLGDCQMNDKVHWYMGDLEAGLDVGRRVDPSGNTQVRLFGGVRGGYFDFERGNDFFANGSNSPADLSQETKFLGAGPRVGVAFRKPLGSNRNIQLAGGLAGAVLFGNRETVVRTNVDGSTSRASKNDFETVWNAEAELALSAGVGRGVKIEVGYRGAYWGNVINLPDPDGGPGSLFFGSSALDDMTEGDTYDHGPFLRLTYAFSAPRAADMAAESLPSTYKTANMTAYPAGGADTADLKKLTQQLERQQKLLDAQQEQLEAQRKLLTAQQVQLNKLVRTQKASLR